MGENEEIQVRVEASIAAIDAGKWDACAAGASGSDRPQPFLAHAFLSALEESGSAVPERGWHPAHLVLDGADGGISGCAPCYLKTHSQGEYVFDHGWADAYERAGGQYYPKLQIAVPFTPVTGPRLLTRSGPRAADNRTLLARAAAQLTGQLDASSLHLTFLEKSEWDALGALGFLQRTDQQFHWHNNGYETFDDFLGELSSRKRKLIRRERRDALCGGDITIEHVTGRDLGEHHWDSFFEFYTDTGSRKWGRPYLTRRFFSLIGERMADQILLVLCRRAGRTIAGALNFIGTEALYGRYWGALEHHRFLHFEACYYQAIEFAIANKLARVEAGAQGPHKLARGYLPETTYSVHYIADPGLSDAVAHFLGQEQRYVADDIAYLRAHSPFREKG